MQKDALLWPQGNGGRALLIKYYREGGKNRKGYMELSWKDGSAQHTAEGSVL